MADDDVQVTMDDEGYTRKGGWARERVSPVGTGMRIKFRRKPGVTKPGLLQVPFEFQVPPLDELGWERMASHPEYQTLRAGTYSRAGAVSLRTLTISTVLVNYDPGQYDDRGARITHGFSNWDEPGVTVPPRWQLQELEELLESKTAFWVMCGLPGHRGDWDVQMLANMTQLRPVERAGEPDSIYVTMAFQEYRQVKLNRRRKGPRSQSYKITVTFLREELGMAFGTVTGLPGGLMEGQITLRGIAKRAYGSEYQGGDWTQILKANPKLKGLGGNDSIALWMHGQGRKGLKTITLIIPNDDTNSEEIAAAEAREVALAGAEAAENEAKARERARIA